MKRILIALACIVACVASSAYASDAVLSNAAYLYKLQAFPVSPTLVEMTFTGSHNRGEIYIRTANPNTTCIAWPNQPVICGNRASDVEFFIDADRG